MPATLGMLLGTNVGGLWYWCLDQAIAQRVLAARDVHHARAATVFAGYLKLTPIFLMVLPGIVARALFADELAGNTNSALPLMMKRLLPPGILGLMLAATVAACMSSLDSVFTAAASLFCVATLCCEICKVDSVYLKSRSVVIWAALHE